MATLRKRAGSWLLTWSDDQGQHRRVIGRVNAISRREAEARLKELEYHLATGGRGSAPQVPTFASFAEEYIEWRKKEFPHSQQRIKQILDDYLVPQFGTTALDQMTPQSVERYKHARSAAGAAPETVLKELRTLQALMNRAVTWDIVPRNPVRGVKPPQQLTSSPPHFFTAQELRKLYAASPFHRPIWQLLANTGLRRGEAVNLSWQNVTPQHILVPSSASARTKSGKHRKIPLSPGAAAALRELKTLTGATGKVLPSTTLPSLSRAFHRCARRAKLAGSLHSLRHTFGTHLAMKGTPVNVIKELMGHSTIRVTEQYLHASSPFLRSAVKNLTL